MLFYHAEKFFGRHLKRDRNILISIHHDHIIFLVFCLQISTSIISCHFYIIRQGKIFPGKVGDFFINLHTFHLHITKIFFTLCRIGTGSHTKNQHIHIFCFFLWHHQRCCHSIIVIHSGQSIFFHIDRLHAKQYVCGQNHLSVIFRHLQIIVNRLSFVS